MAEKTNWNIQDVCKIINKPYKDLKTKNICLRPESNSIIKRWDELGVNSENAFETQALLQLKNEYCSKKKCLYCPVGIKLIKVENES